MARTASVLVLILLVTVGLEVDVAPKLSGKENLEKAVGYLRSIAYNPNLKLCREAPRVGRNIYWVASDNLLAYKALEPYDSRLASTIRSELIRIAKLYSLPSSAHGLPLSLRYDVVMRDDATLEMPPRNITHITLYNGSYLLRYDIANGSGTFEDWREYADLRLLIALSNDVMGDHGNAVSNFTSAANMWDGVGLRDKAHRFRYGEGQAPWAPNAYATYKLGLLLYVSWRLGMHLSFQQDVVDRIWSMQNQTSGGIFTHILPDGGRGESDTNTETTALVILGMTGIEPRPSNGFPGFPLGISVIAAVGLVVLAIAILLTRHRGER